MILTLAQTLSTPSPQGGGEFRRGACPGLSAPMPTGDGLLARLLPTGTIPLDAFQALCAAAREHGNGIIEITARGSIQVRGLSAASAVRFAAAIAKLNIAASDTIQVQSNPLAGLDPEEILDASEIAAALRRALAKTPLPRHLAPKVSVIVDGGGAPSLGHLVADVRLRAGRSNDQVVFHLSVAGDQTNAMALGSVVLDHAIEVPLHLLDVIARSGHAARARDVVAADAGDAFRAAIADFLMPNAPPPSVQQPSEPIGTYPLRDGTVACGLGLAFGHATAASLEELTRAAAAQGAAGLRTAPGRALLILGLARQAAASMAAAAERLGFVVHADDARRSVFACAGAPICSSAYIAARAMAPRVAEIAASRLGTDFDIHISGCAKGCAHSKQAALTIVGTANGCAMIAGGRPGGVPFATVPTDELPEAIARFADASRREGSEADGHESCKESSRESSQETDHV
jgi:precorrin-3B synthase